MPVHRPTRRLFLVDLGRGAVGAAMFVATGCTTSDEPATATQAPVTSPPDSSPASPDPTEATAVVATRTPALSASWERVNLGFVSAYVLARDGEAAVVDTGVPGSAGEIEATLGGLGLAWSEVGHVILTHAHGDHVGSLPDVLGAAPDARAYAGALDIPRINSPRSVTAVGAGDLVFGLEVIETPGHTPGHISLLDPAAGALIVGDALNGSGGGVAGPNPQFSSDHPQAIATAKALAERSFETIYFGHGEPVLAGGSELVAELATTL